MGEKKILLTPEKQKVLKEEKRNDNMPLCADVDIIRKMADINYDITACRGWG